MSIYTKNGSGKGKYPRRTVRFYFGNRIFIFEYFLHFFPNLVFTYLINRTKVKYNSDIILTICIKIEKKLNGV